MEGRGDGLPAQPAGSCFLTSGLGQAAHTEAALWHRRRSSSRLSPSWLGGSCTGGTMPGGTWKSADGRPHFRRKWKLGWAGSGHQGLHQQPLFPVRPRECEQCCSAHQLAPSQGTMRAAVGPGSGCGQDTAASVG